MTSTPERAATLIDQHTGLLRDVQRRAAAVRALIDDARVWPHDELATLAGFAQAAVQHQAEHEERLVFPARVPREVAARLEAQHQALRELIDALAQAKAGNCSRAELRRLVGDLLEQLGGHVDEEQAALSGAGPHDAEGDGQ